MRAVQDAYHFSSRLPPPLHSACASVRPAFTAIAESDGKRVPPSVDTVQAAVVEREASNNGGPPVPVRLDRSARLVLAFIGQSALSQTLFAPYLISRRRILVPHISSRPPVASEMNRT